MAGRIFHIKLNDTRPVLDYFCLDKAADGSTSAHDATGVTTSKLHADINGVAFTRTVVANGALTLGNYRYTFVLADWSDITAAGDYKFEIELLGPGGDERITFPNDGHDILRVTADIV